MLIGNRIWGLQARYKNEVSITYIVLQQPPREPQGYQKYRTSERGTIANQMKKEKTMSINKHVDDHQWCRSLLSIGGDNLQFYPNFALFSTLGGWISTTILFKCGNLGKTKRKMQTEHFFSPNSGEDQKKKILKLLWRIQPNYWGNIPPIPLGFRNHWWSQHYRNCTGEHPRPVSSLLKEFIRRKNNEKTKLSNAATENRTREVSLLSKNKTGRGRSPVQFLWCCDYQHACWSTLFSSFSLIVLIFLT